MPNNPVRIILDTNLWISFLITKDHSKLTALLTSGQYILVFSRELFSEFIAVTRRTKFKKYFSDAHVLQLTEVINDYAEFVNVITSVAECRDVKDNFLLSLAIDGKADYLVSGDKDLLELKTIKDTIIITMADLLMKA